VRDSHRTGPASQEEKDAFFAESGWLANSSAAGAPVREFAVKLQPLHKYFAVAFLKLEGMTVSYWPPELTGTGREASFLSGSPPESASFAPGAWQAVR